MSADRARRRAALAAKTHLRRPGTAGARCGSHMRQAQFVTSAADVTCWRCRSDLAADQANHLWQAIDRASRGTP